jgi:hypothetical protein
VVTSTWGGKRRCKLRYHNRSGVIIAPLQLQACKLRALRVLPWRFTSPVARPNPCTLKPCMAPSVAQHVHLFEVFESCSCTIYISTVISLNNLRQVPRHRALTHIPFDIHSIPDDLAEITMNTRTE